MPPGGSSDWQRQTISDETPLELILLCDTSGSMDSSMRKTQLEFVTTMLTSLGDQDRVAVATTDVSTDWILDKFTKSTEKEVETVRSGLEERVSLGWTDLDQAFDAVMEKATAKTQVIYIGDGIVTTSESDPAAFVNRLKRRFEQARTLSGNAPGFHSVSVGSTYESVVLKGIASLGKGSMRQISGEVTPQLTALNLLKEITSPGLKDVQIEFQGIQVAAVYPEELPNIPVGTQQILVGRYLPTGANQSGKIVVTGTLDGKPVKYVANLNLHEAEKGNSFIPRLWARGHLDQLLQQGSNQKIQNEIIALSEEFHIITPYTSLLVLESDADRERFGVKRRYGMRDGEQFFADARSAANYELKQQQMQNAGNWRIGLRRQILGEIAGMGRDATALQSTGEIAARGLRVVKDQLQLGVTPRIILGEEEEAFGTRVYPVGDLVLDVSGRVSSTTTNGTVSNFSVQPDGYYLGDDVQFFPSPGPQDEAFSFYVGMERESRKRKSLENHPFSGSSNGTLDFDRRFQAGKEMDRWGLSSFDSQMSGNTLSYDFHEGKHFAGSALSKRIWDSDEALGQVAAPIRLELESLTALQDSGFLYDLDGRAGLGAGGFSGGANVDFAFEPPGLRQVNRPREIRPNLFESQLYFNDSTSYLGRSSSGRYRTSSRRAQTLNWVNQLFPSLAMPVVQKGDSEEKESEWPKEAVELSKSLLITPDLQALESGGIVIERVMTTWSDDFDRLVPSHRRTELWSSPKWVTVDHAQGQNSIVN